ncbi:hypothetical protein EC845_2244 [Comamonas sp. BIGb0124]|uniref:hypothetical protein n=1 Tax=Comamonas sp. BIGb0124 TaxID=2485130 RepID=UPI000FB2B36E|nr:hypothetical protein [Comamonas sp. BIGb0124]ROR21426.1 hypothetical protein EC845_2244 [Comamonas sp. BIGb0124]
MTNVLPFRGKQHAAAEADTDPYRSLFSLPPIDPATPLLALTPAEKFCKAALKGLRKDKYWNQYKIDQVDERFHAHPQQLPQSLDDCLAEIEYWDHLNRLRSSLGAAVAESLPVQARRHFLRRCLSVIQPVNGAEIAAVIRYLVEKGLLDPEAEGIVLNLV